MNFLINAAEVMNYLDNDNYNRQFNIRDDAFELTDIQFKQIFRLNKDVMEQFINVLQPYMVDATRISSVDIRTKVLCAVRFMASGSYQIDIGQNRCLRISQPTVSRCLHEVINAANQAAVMNEWIHFPSNYGELVNIRDRFRDRFNISAIGCVDCTHVAIVPPKDNHDVYPEHVYVNRKGFHSLNVQLICDSNLRIMNVNAKFPGSVHVSHIWKSSSISNSVENIYRLWPNEFFHLFGDSGYYNRPWLVTPFNNPADESPEALFNQLFIRARTSIERCNGLLKMKWRCLHRDRVLHYTPTTASKIVNTCVILHNMSLQNNEPIHRNEPVDNIFNDINEINNFHIDYDNVNAGRQLRERLLQSLFL